MSHKKAGKARRRDQARQRRAGKEARRRATRAGTRRPLPSGDPAWAIHEPLRMSDVIAEFALPLLDGGEDKEQFNTAIRTAVVLWNVSFLPTDEWRPVIERAGACAPELTAAVLPLLESMMTRRRREFAGIDCMVLDHEVRLDRDEVRLRVVWRPLDLNALREWVHDVSACVIGEPRGPVVTAQPRREPSPVPSQQELPLLPA